MLLPVGIDQEAFDGSARYLPVRAQSTHWRAILIADSNIVAPMEQSSRNLRCQERF